MKKYFVVVSTFDNRGNVTASIVDTIKAEKKPEQDYKSTRSKDIYTDYFDTLEEAKEFVEEARLA